MTSTKFINECKNRANANRLGQVIVDGIDTPITNSNYLQKLEIDSGCYVNGDIIGSVYAKCLKANFISDQNNLTDKSIETKIGVKYADLSNEYINMGNYKVTRPNNEITANMSQITAYSDLYTNLDSKYICNIDYSTGNKTVSDLYADVCSNLGLTPKTLEFINSTIPIYDNPFTNGEKNRTVLQTIAKISCSFVDIDNDTNIIDLCWLSSNEEPDYVFNLNDYSSVEGGQIVCGPINCLIIKNSQVDDENLTIKDDESIKIYGENSIIISDDYILHNAELRQQAINYIWNRVKGMKYVDCKLTTYYGKPFLKLGAKIRIYVNDTDYFDTYVLKHNFTYDGSFTSVIESPALTKQEIKTKQDVSLGQALKNTQIDVDKQKQQIKLLNKKVDDLSDFIKTKQSVTFIELSNTPNSNGAINKLSIKNFNLQTLYPDMAYPSDYTYPGVLNFYTLIISNEKVIYSPSLPTANNQTELYNVGGISGKFYRCVDNVWTEETKLDNIKFIYINSPFPLQTLTTTMGDPVYDELIFEDNQVSIIQRLGYDKENNLEVLEKPVTYNLGEMLVPTFETNTYITMKYWTNLNYECTYIEKNEFTSSFTTKNETNAIISITDEINLKVENKCEKDDVVNQLNISKDLIEIKGNRFVLDADNVKIDKFGNIILSNGAKVLGEYGLLSSIIVESNIMSRSFMGGNMILPMGYSQYEETSSGSLTTIKDSLQLQFTIPKGFKIMSAFILLEHMPTKYKDGTTLKYTGTSKNLKLYRATNYSAGTFEMDITHYVTNNSGTNYSEVPNAFGVSGFSGSSSGYTSKQSINIKDFITTSDTEDSFNMFKIETSNSLVTSLAAMYQNSGACKATLTIMGYSSFE